MRTHHGCFFFGILDSGLFDLDIPARDVDRISVGFEPGNINITPNDTFLLLRESDTRIQIFDVATGEIARGGVLRGAGRVFVASPSPRLPVGRSRMSRAE